MFAQHLFRHAYGQLVDTTGPVLASKWDVMNIDVSIAHEPSWSRVTVQGQPTLGCLLSLLQVLEVDSASWTGEAVLLDLRRAHGHLSPEEQGRLLAEAARALGRMRKIAFLAPGGLLQETTVIGVFQDEGGALQWLREP